MSSDVTVNIRLDAAVLHDDEAALRREWLVTNGLGGYASASVAGANTRRYHGLLVAALHAPVGRAVLLSKLEETLTITSPNSSDTSTFALSTNLYPGAMYPQGHHTLESWEAYPVPTWVWSPTPGVRFEKQVWMARQRNTTYVSYRLLAAPEGSTVRLQLVPLLAWKDYHSEMHAGSSVPIAWFPPTTATSTDSAALPGTLRVTLPGVPNVTSEPQNLRLRCVLEDGTPYPDMTFADSPNWYYNFQHPREQERGLNFQEDLYTPGTFSASLTVGQSLVVIASVEDTSDDAPQAARDAWTTRQAELLAKADVQEEFAQLLTLAADQFLVQVPGGRTTVIAGYPWFSDWGRDTMIALPGLCLATGRAELAREILLSFAAFVDHGMLPNRFPDVGETPEYNTVDATLWYFAAIYQYVIATGDMALVKDALWSVLEGIVHYHQAGTRYNIHEDVDGLLYAGQPGVQLTWMDAKVGDWVVTPRIGKPVEISALWHNALRTMAYFARRLGNTQAEAHYGELAERTAASFATRFTRSDGRGLYDVLETPNNGAPDPAIRPNQVFALSLPFAPLDAAARIAQAILKVVQDELRTDFGLRTLSPNDPAYRPRYEGDQGSRDGAYHQGTAWPWLLGPYAEAYHKVYGDKEGTLAILKPFRTQLAEFGLGSIAEIFDGSAPQRPNGCIAQAWSVGEVLRVWKSLLEH